MSAAELEGLVLRPQGAVPGVTDLTFPHSRDHAVATPTMTHCVPKGAPPLRCYRLTLPLALGLGLAGVASATQTGDIGDSRVPKYSKPAHAPTLIPGGSFEQPIQSSDPGLDQSPHHVRSPAYAGWTFMHGCGIARDDSPFLSTTNATAIDGARVAFLQNASAYVETTLVAQPEGMYRIRFQAAPRDYQGTNMPHLEVLIDSERMAAMALHEHDAPVDHFHEYVTRPFVVPAGNPDVLLRIAKSSENPLGIDNHTAFIDNVRIERIREWHDASTWSPPGVPITADYAIVDVNHAVGIQGTAEVGGISILGQLLAGNADGGLKTGFVRVSGLGALLEVGREEAPFQDEFLLELTDDDPVSTAIPSDHWGAGEKFLLVEGGGMVDLHGKDKTSWTHLASTASIADTTIDLVNSPSGWEAGDEIVIAGTTHQQLIEGDPASALYMGHKYVDFAEEVVLASGSNPYALAAPIAGSNHIGGAAAQSTWNNQSLTASPDTLDQSAEVANLTRNVKVRGDASSVNSLVGGHVMMRFAGADAGKARFSNVEFKWMGQNGVLGRYPIHFHMLKGEGQGSRVDNCSIHETFNRAVTIHATDYVEFTDNVAYRNIGHAVFLEDGSEQFNDISRNLVLSTIRPGSAESPNSQGVIRSDTNKDNFRDRSPASFWITNPHNIIEDNVAAGTVGCGFWLIFPRTVHGPSTADSDLMGRTPPIRQSFMHDAVTDEPRFRGNVAHSCQLGLDLNDAIPDLVPSHPNYGAQPRFGDDFLAFIVDGVRTGVSWMPSRVINGVRTDITETLLDFTAYACGTGIYSSTGGDRVKYKKVIVADTNICVDMAAGHQFEDCTLAASAKAEIIPYPLLGAPFEEFRQVAFKLYDGPAVYDRVAFHGFDVMGKPLWSPRGPAMAHVNEVLEDVMFPASPWLSSDNDLRWVEWPLSTTSAFDLTSLSQKHYANSVVNIAFAPGRFSPRAWGKTVFDRQGSLSGNPGHSIVPWNPIFEAPGWARYQNGPGFIHMTSGSGVDWPIDHADAAAFPYDLDERQAVMVSPARYAHLRIEYSRGATFTRETVTDDMDLYVNRVFPAEGGTGTNREMTYVHEFIDGLTYKQMPVVVERASTAPADRVQYTLDHEDMLFALDFRGMRIIHDNSLEGDIGWYWLQDLRTKTMAQLSATSQDSQGNLHAVMETSDLSVAENATEPCLYFETVNGVVGRVALKVYTRGATTGESCPAGAPFTQGQSNPVTTGKPEFGGSRFLDASEWRSERITIQW